MDRGLALAYSTFQVEIDRLDVSGWRWVEYLRQIRNRYVGAFSFNYDLVYESALQTAGIAYSRIVQGETGGTPLIKPHGSIDFEYANLISGVTPRYPLSMFCGYNNTPALRVPRDALLAPRFGPELVAPLQSSLIRGFQWGRSRLQVVHRQRRLIGAMHLPAIRVFSADLITEVPHPGRV